jgi:hypothetical protein
MDSRYFVRLKTSMVTELSKCSWAASHVSHIVCRYSLRLRAFTDHEWQECEHLERELWPPLPI